jgi:hypothetical protein
VRTAGPSDLQTKFLVLLRHKRLFRLLAQKSKSQAEFVSLSGLLISLPYGLSVRCHLAGKHRFDTRVDQQPQPQPYISIHILKTS